MAKIKIRLQVFLVCLIFGALILSGCLSKSKPATYEDFNINAKWNMAGDAIKLNSYGATGIVILAVESSRTDLFYRAYDKSDSMRELYFNKPKNEDNYQQDLQVNLNFNDKSKEIEVCASTKEIFSKNSEGVVCKSSALPSKFDFEVSPTSLTFLFTKSSIGQNFKKSLTIKNTGNMTLTLHLNMPNILNIPNRNSDYTYVFDGNGVIKPGESTQVEIIAWDYNYNDGNYLPTGFYKTDGYIFDTRRNDFKKSFTLETTVTR